MSNNKLTEAQRLADVCPDCEFDPAEPDYHRATCRRIAMSMPSALGGPDRSAWPDPELDLQLGPPWADWPDGVNPVNPLAGGN